MNRRTLLASVSAPALLPLLGNRATATSVIEAPPPSGNDDAPMVQQLLNDANPGGRVEFPAGTYILGSGVSYNTNTQKAPSISIRGAGRYATTFDRRGGSGYAFYFQSVASGNFQVGLDIQDIGITTTAGTGYRSGIYLKGIYQAFLKNVRVEGMTGHGVCIESPLGDPDASINVTLDNCWLWNNGLYGLAAICGLNTANISYLALRSCSIQGNLGAGMYWTGAVCSIRDTALAANKGLGGLYVDFSGANNMNLSMDSVTFENNSPRHIDVRSLMAWKMDNCDFRHTMASVFPAAEGIRLNPAPTALITRPVMATPNIFAIPEYAPYTFIAGPIQARMIEPMWRQFPFPGQMKGPVVES